MADLTESALDPRMASAIAQSLFLRAANSSLETQLTAASLFLNGNATRWDLPVFENSPDWVAYTAGENVLVLFLGATNAALVRAIADGYTASTLQRGPRGFHPLAESMGTLVSNSLQSQGMGMRHRLIIGGYSWGGVVAMAATARIQQWMIPLATTVCTFGSPCPGDARARIEVGTGDVHRWMNGGDNVTLYPPSQAQSPLLSFLQSNAARQNMNAYVQIADGHVMLANSSVYPDMNIPTPQTNVDVSLAAFLLSNSAAVAGEHSMATYYNRIAAYVSILPQPAIFPGNANLDQPRLPAAPRNPLADQPRIPGTPLPIPDVVRPQQTFNGAYSPYKSTREGGVPVVQYEGITLCVAKSGTAARNLARSLNTSWRRWNRTRVGNASAFEFSVSEAFLD